MARINTINVQGDMIINEFAYQNFDVHKFNTEIDDAVHRISNILELEQEQKKIVIGLLNEAKRCVEVNDAKAIKSCQSDFNGFKKFASNAANLVLPVLANLATIAQFFGIGVNAST